MRLPLIILINALINGGMFLSFFYVPQLAWQLQMTPRDFSILTAASAVLMLLTNYAAGWWSDRHGRLGLVRTGFLCALASFVLFLTAQSLPTLVVGRLLLGFAWGLFNGVFIAYVSDAGLPLGRYSAFASLGATVLLTGSAVATHWLGLRVVYGVGAAAFSLALVGALWLPDLPRKHATRVFWPRELLAANWNIYLAGLLRHTGAASLWALWVYYLTALGARNHDIGFINAVNTGTQFIFAWWLLDRIRNTSAMRWGMILSALCFFSFVFARNHFDIYPTQVILGASWAFFYAGSLKALEERNPADKGAALGMFGSVLQFSFVLGPVISWLLIGDLKTELDAAGGLAFAAQFKGEIVHRFHHIIYFATAMALAAWLLTLPRGKRVLSDEAEAALVPVRPHPDL